MRLAFVFTSLLAVGTSLAACKQAEGEHCQVTSDCEDGLVCAPLTDTCERNVVNPRDAGPDAEPADAAPPDAIPLDAGPDAGPPDAAP
jgi:hypothetical protein